LEQYPLLPYLASESKHPVMQKHPKNERFEILLPPWGTVKRESYHGVSLDVGVSFQ
jgi:hypothetical protein